AIYPLLFFLFVSDDDHPIIESVGFSAVDNINIETGVPDGQHTPSNRLIFATRSTMTVEPSHPAQTSFESPEEQSSENKAHTVL
ncbi:hypothetical protein H0H92_009969, partial [Tricholoma furcatifolium]